MRVHVIAWSIVALIVFGLVGLNLYQVGRVTTLNEMNTSLRVENLDLKSECRAVLVRSELVGDRAKNIRQDYIRLQGEIIKSVPANSMGGAVTRWASHEEISTTSPPWWQRLMGILPRGVGGPDADSGP